MTAGIACWCTRGALDAFGTGQTVTRVATLPSGPELLGLVMLVLIVAAGAAALLVRAVAHRPREGGRQEPAGAALPWPPAVLGLALPLFTLGLLTVPYWPWLPDVCEFLRSLAGPLALVAWSVVAGQVVWAAWSLWNDRAPAPDTARRGLPAWARPMAIFVLSLAVFGGAATKLMNSSLYPGGDEPHYLVMMHSLWHDHDLRIENNHDQRDYAAFYQGLLAPDYRARGADGQIYSIHPVGLPLLGAAVYGMGGYRGVVWLLVVMAATTALLLWQWARALTGSNEAATAAWAAVCVGAPFLFNSFAVYPEIPAALCVMIAIGWRADSESPRATEYLVRGLAVSALPWLSSKYAPMALVLAAALAWRTRRQSRPLAALAGPLGLSLVAWLGFFYRTWGSFLPSAPYGGNSQTSLATLFVGGPGLLFDQEYGVLLYAPALAVGIAGLARMSRDRDGLLRSRAIEAALAAGALFATVGSYELWWGGSAPPGRPIVSALPLLGLPFAWQYRRSAAEPVVRAAYRFLVLAGVSVSVVMLFAENGLLIAQRRTGASVLLEYLAPLWNAPAVAPSFVPANLHHAPGLTLVWVAAAVASWMLVRRSRVQAPGPAALAAAGCLGLALLAIPLATPARLRNAADSRWNPSARSRAAILDAFDARARPLAVVYDPFRIVDPSTIPPLMTFEARDPRPGRQPMPVFLNARFALPAGEYTVEIGGATRDANGTVGLQVGRIGGPLWEWGASVGLERPWRTAFTLPVDSEFVGFRTSPELDAASRLQLRPVRIVDRSDRLPGPPVLWSVAYPAALVFFRNEVVWPEPKGFWIRGGATASTTVVPAGASADHVMLRIHSGVRPNTVTIEIPYWRQRVDLVPKVPADVRVPVRRDRPATPLWITPSDGFVPAEVNPPSVDRRLLGCWVEFVSDAR